MDRTRIGSTLLKGNESLVLMADTRIDCGNDAFQFVVEFPDLGQSANQHELNHRTYVGKIGFSYAPYMATTRDGDPPIGYAHRSKALLGKGTFGEVHKAVNTKNGQLCAIKLLTHGGPNISTGDQLHEAKPLSRLSHVSRHDIPCGLLLTSISRTLSDTMTPSHSGARFVSLWS